MRVVVIAAIGTLAAVGAQPSYAGSAADESIKIIEVCRSKTAGKERENCYEATIITFSLMLDAQADELKKQQDTKTSNTKDTVNSPVTEYKVIDSDDLHISPNKYVGRAIELRNMQCIHADKNEYRCVSKSSMVTAIFAADVKPAEEKAKIEDSCGSVKDMTKAACSKTLRLVLSDVSNDTLSGYRKRVIGLAKAIEIVPAPQRKRR